LHAALDGLAGCRRDEKVDMPGHGMMAKPWIRYRP
jgi:hypothetical protein